MKVVFDQDTYVASTWGHADSFEAGVPKSVGHDFGVLCLQQGAKEVEEGAVETAPVVEEAPVEETPVEETATEEPAVSFEDMTKVQLEEYGRTLGIELDRRKTKAALIEELKAALN
tara:strand:- start:276 stop:623 length:348 start_codon:yes stop_codon:yes gene_type:complete